MIKHLNLIPSTHNITERIFTDEEVFVAIRSEERAYTVVSNWFFQKARAYAIGTWQKKYPRLQEADWEFIFSEVDFKLVKRIRKGMTLEGTQLLTYYTTITDYAVLDYLKLQRKEKNSSIEEVVLPKVVLPSSALEKEELAMELTNFLEKITQNKSQVEVLQLFSKGYSYREIVERTDYKSEGACRNAFLKAKKKILSYIQKYPEQGNILRKLLRN